MIAMISESTIIDQILRQIKDSIDIEVKREMVAQQVQNMDKKLQIMNVLRELNNQQGFKKEPDFDILDKQRQLKRQLIDLSIEDDKIVLDSLSKL